jgi:hypothetical protein
MDGKNPKFSSPDGERPSGINGVANGVSNWFGAGIMYQYEIAMKVPMTNYSIFKDEVKDFHDTWSSGNSCKKEDCSHYNPKDNSGSEYIIWYGPG